MLDTNSIPTHLRQRLLPLLGLVEKFGIADDSYRLQTLKNASHAELAHLREAVAANDDALDEWLGGAEAACPIWTDTYIAFSAMRMAADESAVGL